MTGGCRNHLLINTAGTTVWTEFVNEIEKVLTKKHAADGFVGDWQPRSESSTKTSLRRIFGTWRGNAERTPNTCKTTKQVDGLARTTKSKASPAQAEAKARKTKARGKRVNTTGRKGMISRTVEEHDDAQDTQTIQDSTSWTDTCWDHADNWTVTGGSSEWTTGLWADPAWEQAARQLAPPQTAQEQSEPTHGGSISMFGGLTMCELVTSDSTVNKMKGTKFGTTLGTIGTTSGCGTR